MIGPDHPTVGPDVEQLKARCRAQHRQRIADTREEALLCRRQYDDQLEEHGEVARQLHGDLAAAALKLHAEIRVYRDEVGDFPLMDDIRNEAWGFDGHVADNPKTPAKLFADYIDALDATATALGFVRGEE